MGFSIAIDCIKFYTNVAARVADPNSAGQFAPDNKEIRVGDVPGLLLSGDREIERQQVATLAMQRRADGFERGTSNGARLAGLQRLAFALVRVLGSTR